jgi:hypothetical protein
VVPGYKYELVYPDGATIRRAAYWSAYRLSRGSKVLAEDVLLVVEETLPSKDPAAELVAHCRLAREDEQFR